MWLLIMAYKFDLYTSTVLSTSTLVNWGAMVSLTADINAVSPDRRGRMVMLHEEPGHPDNLMGTLA